MSRLRPIAAALLLLLAAALPAAAAPAPQDDFSALDAALLFSNARAHYPISDAFEADCPQEAHRWWLDRPDLALEGGQRVHVVAYLGHCAWLPARQADSMRHVWSGNGLKNAAACLWILEALGESPATVQAAADAARAVAAAGEKQPGQTRAVKAVVPWSRVAELLAAHQLRAPQFYLSK